MSMMRWDPFRELESLREDVNRLFQETLGRPARGATANRVWSPAVDVIEDEEKFVLRAELPGMRKGDIDIEIHGDTLTIKGERKFEAEEKKENYIRVERAYGKFQRSFTLNVPVKANEIKASYKDGILEITVPKAEEIKPKKVEVVVES